MSTCTVRIFQILLLSLLFIRCAQVAPLGGGKRDTAPPKLLEAIPANKRGHFNSATIVLRFDEFVKLSNLSEQLIITPKIEKTPEITSDGKKITVNLNRDELIPHTTYRFYFGNAITDMRESNVLKDFEYIFSTGPFTDSLKVSGNIHDAFNNKESGGLLVGLYDNSAHLDSLPYKHKPDYYTKANATGGFTISCLPPRQFEVYAFTDNNKNFLYDGDAEKIGLLGPPLYVMSDTIIKLRVFQEESARLYIKKTQSPYYGYGMVLLNKKSKVLISTLAAKDSLRINETMKGKMKDTIAFYYKDVMDTLAFIVRYNNPPRADTVKLVVPRSNSKGRIKKISLNTSGDKLNQGNPLRITFPVWMDTLRKDFSRLSLMQKKDTLVVNENIKGWWPGVSVFELTNKLNEGATYTLRMDTAAFFDVRGIATDSASLGFKTPLKTDFGRLVINLKVNRKQHYIAQLINEQDKVVRERLLTFSFSSSNATLLDFIALEPGVYKFRLLYDNNENNRWDAGNPVVKLLPEQVFISSKQIKVLADWEIEEEIIVRE